MRVGILVLLLAGCARENPEMMEGTGGGGGEPGMPSPKQELHLATDLTIKEVAIFQAVKIPLGVTPAPAPIVAGRDALVRVYVAPAAGFKARELACELYLDGKKLSASRVVSAASTDAALDSTFNFELTGDLVKADSVLSALLIDPAAPGVAPTQTSKARWPENAMPHKLAALASAPLKLVLVPFRYDGDGSKRLPDTSQTQIDRYRRWMYETYPVSAVDITVHAPLVWSYQFDGDFGYLNDKLVDVREQEAPADDVYYYGLIAPASSFSAYCQGGCTTGQTFMVDDVRDAAIRVGSGVGFTGSDSAETMVHELGHAHGREHAPCDVRRWDPSFPDPDGRITVWGYALQQRKLYEPDTADFMGYCEPSWVSPYTYSALFDRVTALVALKAKPSMRPYRIGEANVLLSHPPVRIDETRPAR